MKIVNEALLAEFRTPGACEFCKRPCMSREPHHIFTRGAGQLDHPVNLISLGTASQCPCHREFHDGHIRRADFLVIVAQREGVLQDQIEDAVYFLRGLPKAPRPWQVQERLVDMTSARPLVERILRELNLEW